MSDFPTAPPPMNASAGIPATFGQRFIAVLIDGLLGMALLIPVLIVVFILTAISDVLFLIGMLLYLVAALAWLYAILGGIGATGQSPGKRMQGIKVVNDAGGTIGLGGSVIRYLVQTISNSIICGLPIGGLWMLFDPDKKTLYDKVLNNQVIQGVEKGGVFPIFPDGNPI